MGLFHLFFDSKIASKRDLRKFQVVQVKENELLLRLVCDQLSEDEKNVIIDNITGRLGAIMISFSFEKDIENSPSGKYRPVINKLL